MPANRSIGRMCPWYALIAQAAVTFRAIVDVVLLLRENKRAYPITIRDARRAVETSSSFLYDEMVASLGTRSKITDNSHFQCAVIDVKHNSHGARFCRDQCDWQFQKKSLTSFRDLWRRPGIKRAANAYRNNKTQMRKRKSEGVGRGKRRVKHCRLTLLPAINVSHQITRLHFYEYFQGWTVSRRHLFRVS